MFNVKKPCVDCPFRAGSITTKTLPLERMIDITEDILNDGHFFCHKTTHGTENNDNGKFKVQPGNELCAGSILYMQREGANTQYLEIMERMGAYTPSDYKEIECLIEPLHKKEVPK